jgi:archaellum biogenesis protein FlaJ (TadC family)
MSRVWKKFLTRIATAVAVLISAVLIVVGSIVGLMAIGVNPDAAVMITLSVVFFIPMSFFILYQVYKDCKEDVEAENKKMMRELRGF